MNKIDWIEHLLITAKERRMVYKFPHRYNVELALNECHERVLMAVKGFDELGIQWSVQNRALDYVNDYDTEKPDVLWAVSLRKLAFELLNK